MNNIYELFGKNINSSQDWNYLVREQHCPYLNKKCLKNRKSNSDISIGVCTVEYGKNNNHIIICPHRLLQGKKIFNDCIHLLERHEPGNDLHLLPEITIPGGHVDYFLVSTKNNQVVDFVGIELQTLDTTGSVWSARQRFLNQKNIISDEHIDNLTYGMNWKMTSKTILMQIHHKLKTFESINKHLVLVIQNYLLDYFRKEFNFEEINNVLQCDPFHIHSYSIDNNTSKLVLSSRVSTDSAGMDSCLGLRANQHIELETIINELNNKVSESTLFTIV